MRSVKQTIIETQAVKRTGGGLSGNSVLVATPARFTANNSESGIRIIKTYNLTEAAHLAQNYEADVVITNTDTSLEVLNDLISKLGGALSSRSFDLVRDIKYDPANKYSIAESLSALPHHTDGSFEERPPWSFVLQFVKTDLNGGGVNSFISVTRMLAQMPMELLTAACTARVQFGRKDDSGTIHTAVSTIIYRRQDHNSSGFRWRDDDQVSPVVVDDCGMPINEAINWIRNYVKNAPRLDYIGQVGDLVIVMNDQVTHARSALSASSPRWLRRAWIS